MNVDETKGKIIYTHAVVLFPDEKPGKDGVVDLVPLSWIHRKGKRWLCFYPNVEDYDKRDGWVEDSRLPDPAWGQYHTQILKKAVDYKQGKRRLLRSYEALKIESSTANDATEASSSEASSLKPSNQPPAMTRAELKKAFENIPPFPEAPEAPKQTGSNSFGGSPSQEKCKKRLVSKRSRERTLASHTDTPIIYSSNASGSSPSPKKSKEDSVPKKSRGRTLASHTDTPIIYSSNSSGSSPSQRKSKKSSVLKRGRGQTPGSRVDASKSYVSSSSGGSLFERKSEKTSVSKRNKGLTSSYVDIEEKYSSTSSGASPQNRMKEGSISGKNPPGTPVSHTDAAYKQRRLQLESPISSRSNDSFRSKTTKKTGKERVGKKILEVTYESFERMEERIIRKITSMKRSLLFDVDKKFASLHNTLLLSTDLTQAEDLSEITALGSKLPMKTLQEFVTFDNTVKNDDTNKSQTTLMKFMLPISRGSLTVHSAIGRILSSLISKDVQLLYSGVGRESNGKAKLNFSQTSVYTCMTDVLLRTHEKVKLPEIITKTSRWLAGALDRDGGKKKTN